MQGRPEQRHWQPLIAVINEPNRRMKVATLVDGGLLGERRKWYADVISSLQEVRRSGRITAGSQQNVGNLDLSSHLWTTKGRHQFRRTISWTCYQKNLGGDDEE
ncbi:hypothetical protein Ancab_032175 [Ancistrocladus abbreviatus]